VFVRRVVRYLIGGALLATGCVPVVVGFDEQVLRVRWDEGEPSRRFRAVVTFDERAVDMTEELRAVDRLSVWTGQTEHVVVVSVDGADDDPSSVSEFPGGFDVRGLRDGCVVGQPCERTVTFSLRRLRREREERMERVWVEYRLSRTEIRGLPVRVPNDAEVGLVVQELDAR